MFDKFRAAPPYQQIQLVLGGAVLVTMLLLATWFFFLRTTYELLFSDLKISDASAIVAEMEHRKIPYRLANGGTSILVPSGTADNTRLALTGADMPIKGTVGFELFNKADLGLTDFAQKINYQRALQGELERTIMTLDGVDTARVHLSLGEDRLFRDDQVAPKASVTIRMAKGAHLSEGFAQGVRRLVAAAVPKLEPADVVILNEAGQSISSGPDMPAVSSVSPYVEARQAIEQYYEARSRQALSDAGMSGLTVSISAQLLAPDKVLLSDWAPAARNFPLHVTVSSLASWSAEQQNRVRETIDKAIAAPGQTDAIAFESTIADTDIPTFTRAPAVVSGQSVMTEPADKDDQSLFNWLLIGVPATAVVFAGFWLLRKLRGPRPLDAKRRAEFVDRLRAALEEREAHAVSRS